jgi:hypothetical protein
LYTPLKNGTKRNDIFYTRYDFYTLYYYNFEKWQNYYLIKNLTFSSSPNFWNITDDIIKNELKNSSTEKTISFVKQILSNDTSNKPDYYKIGKWVYNNIHYNHNHNTTSNADDILNKREGVCHHLTILYDALLNSIGIKALYASGKSIDNINTLEKGNHAWTVAEIKGKWIGLDATWNIFSGKLPQCHLFVEFNGQYSPDAFIYPTEVEDKAKISIIEELKLIEIVNLTTKQNSNSVTNFNSQNGFKLNILFILILILSQF